MLRADRAEGTVADTRPVPAATTGAPAERAPQAASAPLAAAAAAPAHGPRTASLQARADHFQRGPRMVAQRRRLQGALGAAVQMKKSGDGGGPGALSAASLLSQLEQDPFLRDKLQQPHRGQRLRDAVSQGIQTYLEMYGARRQDSEDIAMMLSLTLQGVARVIARALYEPGLESSLATRLFELYDAELQAATGQQPAQAAQTVGLAKALSADNPFELYMHEEIGAEQAAERIRRMARASSADGVGAAAAMHTMALLKKRYEADLGWRTFASVGAQEDKGHGGKFKVSEATGEISQRYFTRTFERDATTDQPKRDVGGLVYTSAAVGRMDLLLSALRRPTAATAAVTPRAGVTPGQEAHLAAVERSDAQVDKGNARDALAAWLVKWAGMAPAQARAHVAATETWLQSAPITITAPASKWFGAIPTGAATTFAPVTRQERSTAEQQVFGPRGDKDRVVKHTGRYDDPEFVAERGENYLRFRHFKDVKMTGGGLGPAEMPTFGALNPDLTTASRASASATRYADLTAEQQQEKATNPKRNLVFGENYYGNLHFVLKRSSVAQRLVYTASDHGQPRRDPLLAMHDAAGGARSSNFTGLGTDTGINVSTLKLLVHAFNAALSAPAALETESLPFEVQIFGEVDITRDVERILVAESASAAELKNLNDFAQSVSPPIPVVVLAPPPGLQLAKPNTVTLKSAVSAAPPTRP